MNRNQNTSIYCAPGRWERVAREEAISSNLDPVQMLSGNRTRPFVQARWRAWQRLVDAGHSYLSIGNASGFDRTTVMHGVSPTRRERQSARKAALLKFRDTLFLEAAE